MTNKSTLGFNTSHIKTDSFKTTLISVTFITELEKKTAAANALALRLLEGCAASYESKKAFSRALSELYGTKVSSEIIKDGDSQLLRLCVSCIDDSFLPNGDTIKDNIKDLVCDLIFGYKLQNKSFGEDRFNEEKRLLSEEIAGNLNDKRIFARKRAEEITCEGEPYALQPIGTQEEVEKLTMGDVTDAYNRLLSSAFVNLQIVGKETDESLFEEFSKLLKKCDRSFENNHNDIIKSAGEVKTVKDILPVKQGKLVMSYRSDKAGDDLDTAPFFIMSDIFGGAPYAKLFTNVREKMSLCYYCTARPVKKKGLIFVESGVEAENTQKAIEAINKQFEDVKNGDFTDELVACSKRASKDALKGLYSNQSALDRWYAIRSLSCPEMTTDALSDAIDKVTREDIIAAAKSTKIDTIYIIEPKGE